MTSLLEQLELSLDIQETKTHDTQLVWLGNDVDFAVDITGTDKIPTIRGDTHLIIVGDKYALFNRKELTEELVNEIKNELGI